MNTSHWITYQLRLRISLLITNLVTNYQFTNWLKFQSLIAYWLSITDSVIDFLFHNQSPIQLSITDFIMKSCLSYLIPIWLPNTISNPSPEYTSTSSKNPVFQELSTVTVKSVSPSVTTKWPAILRQSPKPSLRPARHRFKYQSPNSILTWLPIIKLNTNLVTNY